MSVDQPFKPQLVRGLRLEAAAAELGARWHQGALDRVEPERKRVITSAGDELARAHRSPARDPDRDDDR